MTNQERAEKILEYLDTVPMRKDYRPIYIASQLDEAYKAREEVWKSNTDLVIKQARAEGFASAREQALEIYKHSGTSLEVEERIRAMRVGK